MLTVCTSATSTGLTTTQRIRDALGTTSTADDGYLSDLIQRAGEWAESYVGYPLQQQVYSETVPAFGGLNLMLSRTPVRNILRVFDSTTTCSATAITSTEYRFDKRAGLIQRDVGWNWTAAKGYGISSYIVPNSELPSYYVEYEAGYVWQGGTSATCGGSSSTGPSLPFDIEQAVIEKVLEWHETPAGGISSKKVGNLAISYTSGSTGDGMAARLLTPYRRQY